MKRFWFLTVLVAAACSNGEQEPPSTATLDSTMTPLAERYVKLVLAVGEHDGNYVDAYYGPAGWREQVKAEKASLDTVALRATQLIVELEPVDVSAAEELVQLRKGYLVRQTQALSAYVRLLKGERLKFDEESQALYDATAPTYPESHFQSMLDSLNTVLPGTGPVPARLARYKQGFVIPKAKLDTVFKAAIAEARKRTAAQVELPAEESFTLES